MATLKEIVNQITDSLNRPFDEQLKERLKDLVIQQFALFASRSINKYGIDKEFVYSYNITSLTTITDETGEIYLQTTNIIPRPLRYSSDTPFVYVGFKNGEQPFSYRNKHSRRYTNLIPNVGNSTSYDFHQDRIRIWNPPMVLDILGEYQVDLDSILVQQVPFDFRFDSNGVKLNEYEFEFPVTIDFIQQIKLSLLQEELRVTDSKDRVEATHLDNE